MNVNTQDAGTVVLTVEEKADVLSIRVEVKDEGSKEQFSKSRDDLAAEARRFGFKNVSVDISSGGDGQRQQQQRQSGNEDIDNVRLAGREDFDLSGAFPVGAGKLYRLDGGICPLALSRRLGMWLARRMRDTKRS